MCYNNLCQWCKDFCIYTLGCVMNGNLVLLLDIYGELLSKTQREALDLKYNSDLSPSEIAEEMGGVSRQSVNEAQKNGEKRLLELEGVLKNAERFSENKRKLDEAKALAEQLRADYSDKRFDELSEILDSIEE